MTMYENLEESMQKIAQEIIQENAGVLGASSATSASSAYGATGVAGASSAYGATGVAGASSRSAYSQRLNDPSTPFTKVYKRPVLQKRAVDVSQKRAAETSQKRALDGLLEELLLEVLKRGGFSIEQFLQSTKGKLEEGKVSSEGDREGFAVGGLEEEEGSFAVGRLQKEEPEVGRLDEEKPQVGKFEAGRLDEEKYKAGKPQVFRCGEQANMPTSYQLFNNSNEYRAQKEEQQYRKEQDLHEQVEKLRKLKVEQERQDAAKRQKAYELELKQKQNCARQREQYDLYFQQEDQLALLAQQEYDQMRMQLAELQAQNEVLKANPPAQMQASIQVPTQMQPPVQTEVAPQQKSALQLESELGFETPMQAPVQAQAQAQTQAQAQPEINVESQMDLQPQFQAPPQAQVQRQAPKCAKPVQLKTPLISIVSASGGTGRSTIALLSAFLCARSGLSTVLIEGDLQFGDFAFWLNLDDECSSLGDENVQPLQIAENLKLYKAPLLPEVAEEVSDDVAALLPKFAEGADIVIADTGGFWNGLTANLLLASELFLMVIDKRPSSVMEAVKAAELCSRIGVPTLRMVGIYNRYNSRVRIEKDDAKDVLDASDMFCIPQGKQIVEDLLSKGDISELIASENPVVLSIDKLLTEILPRVGCAYTEMRLDSRRFLRGRS